MAKSIEVLRSVLGDNIPAEVEEALEHVEADLIDTEASLWRVYPNSYQIPTDHPLGCKIWDEFNGKGETYREAYLRLKEKHNEPF